MKIEGCGGLAAEEVKSVLIFMVTDVEEVDAEDLAAAEELLIIEAEVDTLRTDPAELRLDSP
jgi:hypothetical protein